MSETTDESKTNTTQEESTENKDGEKTTQQTDAQKAEQERIDKIVSERLKRDREKQQKEFDEKLKKEIAERERLAQLSAEEKAAEESKKFQQEAEEKMRNATLKENRADARDILSEKGISTEYVDFVLDQDPEVMNERIKKLEAIRMKDVEAGVNDRLKGQTPTDKTPTNTNTRKADAPRVF